jgi:signal transduction histidine kinase
MPGKLSGIVKPGMGSWILFMGTILLLSAFLMSFLYYHSLDSVPHGNQAAAEMLLRHVFWHMFAMWVLVFAIVGWWGVLLARSQRISHEESLGQNQVLLQEVKARQAAEERAEAENQAKSRYVSVISHELRTPLNSILGYVYLLDADPGIPEKRRRELSIIRAAGEHMTAVIGEAQDFAKIEHGKLVLEARNFDFAALLAEIVSLFSQQAEDKGLAFEFLPASHLPRRAFADDKRIRQVLINLVGNAFKFTKAGKVTLVAGFAGGKAELVVRDTGVGIPEALLPFVFKPFTQGAATASAGTGLGLPISKSLVELMGGTLTVESHEGQGSTFTVEIPLEAVDDGGGEGPEGRPGLALPCGFAGGDRRILVADDAHDDRSFLRQLLLSAGFTVAEAQNGEGVIEMLSAFHPDLVILDLSMSGMGGWATIEALNHQDLPALPQVAILSANAFERPHAPRHGIPKEAFWLKPLAIEPFLAWLARSLSIEWRYPEPTARLAISQKMAIPSEEILQELLHPIVSGYPKGVFAILDNISKMHREFLPFAQKLRALMQSFRLEEAERLVRQALQEKHGGYEEGKHAS